MKKLGYLVLALAIAALASSNAWAQRPGGRFGGGGGFNGLNLLAQKSVQQELKLSDDQAKRVTEQVDKQRASLGELRNMSREERQQKIAERAKADQAAIDSVLNADQQKRFKQISLQQRGAQAFADAEVAQALNLTSDQKSKIRDIQQSAAGERRALFQGGGGGGDRQAALKKLDELRKGSNEKAMDVLTGEQKEKWKSLTGEPFKGEIVRPQFRGGNRAAGAGRRARNAPRSALAVPLSMLLLASFTDGSDGFGALPQVASKAGGQLPTADATVSATDRAWIQVAQLVDGDRRGDARAADERQNRWRHGDGRRPDRAGEMGGPDRQGPPERGERPPRIDGPPDRGPHSARWHEPPGPPRDFEGRRGDGAPGPHFAARDGQGPRPWARRQAHRRGHHFAAWHGHARHRDRGYAMHAHRGHRHHGFAAWQAHRTHSGHGPGGWRDHRGHNQHRFAAWHGHHRHVGRHHASWHHGGDGRHRFAAWHGHHRGHHAGWHGRRGHRGHHFAAWHDHHRHHGGHHHGSRRHGHRI